MRKRSVELMAKMPTQGLGSNFVRADASDDYIVRDVATRHRVERSWARKPAPATVVWKTLGGFRTVGEDGGWRTSDAAFRRLRFRVGRLSCQRFANRCQLNGEWPTVAWPPLGRERAQMGIE